ncbi:MAG: NUDIX hydrolase [Candidatus Micrarchaeia archaeon]
MKEYRPTAVDVVVIHNNEILLIKRKKPPFIGKWCLPGGFVEINEDIEHAAIRETKEETGVDIELLGIIGVYSSPKRDKRHTISIAFLAFPKDNTINLIKNEEVKEVKWFDLDKVPKLGFDHNEIIKDAIKLYTSMQCHGCEHCMGCE